MVLYYCKTVEDFALVITQSELFQGSNLDNPINTLGDSVVILERLRTAQSEVEQILCSRFNIPRLRSSNAEFLRYATAIIAWWHLEINGKGRELVRQKYEDLLSQLKDLSSIVDANGVTIGSGVDGGDGGQPVRKSRILGGKRPDYIEAICVPYVPDLDIPFNPRNHSYPCK
jgi:phage gp36-like protein